MTRQHIGDDTNAPAFTRTGLEAIKGIDTRTARTLESLPQSRDTITDAVNDLIDDTNAIEGEPLLLFDDPTDPILTNVRKLIGGSNVSAAVGATEVALDLTDTGVDPNTYGQPTRILVLVIDAKGRITSAEEIKLDVSDVDGVLKVAHGGTNLSSYAVGDLLYASGATTIAKLADVATGNVLKAGGVGAAPSYGKVDLTTDVSGTLPEANGGFPGGGFTGGPALYTSLTFVDGLCTAAS